MATENTPLLTDAERGPEPEGTTAAPEESHDSSSKAALWVKPLVAAVLTIVAILVIGTLVFPAHIEEPNTCLTPACVHAASEILYNLSPEYQKLDPCTDFRELVCGGWSDRHDMRPDQGSASIPSIMAESSQMLLRHILEAPYPSESKHSSFSPARLLASLSSSDQQNFDKIKDTYNACMDEDTIKKRSADPLLEILQKIKDIALAHSPSKKDEINLPSTVLYLARLGIPAFVSIGVGADDTDPDTVVVQVSAPWSIGLPAKDYYKEEDLLKKYEFTIDQVLKALNGSSSRDDQVFKPLVLDGLANLNYAHEVVKLEKRLAASAPDPEDAYDPTKSYNPMSMDEAIQLTPRLGLFNLINGLAPTDVKTDRVIIGSPQYMKNLTNIISDTPESILHTYLLWKAIQAFASDIEAEAIKPYTRFSNELQGKDADSTPERWMTCVSHVDRGLGWILSRFFVEKAFSAKAKEFGDQIVSDIKDMFIEKLKVTTWMDESVIDLAIDKVHRIVQKIGYPTKSPDIMDPDVLLKYYRPVDINSSSFFDNSISMSRFEVAREWSALGKPVDRDEWGMTVPTVNAYYNPPGNEIVFPAGIMQTPVFDVDVPQYLSYGAFGSISGHELSHAFDSTGRHYDQNGNYTDWWTNSTVEGFEERAECFIHQYHNFTIPGLDDKPIHVNGKLTLGENIADSGGVAAAFAAWKRRESQGPNENLPGLEYFTQEQLFFVSYATFFCGKMRKEAAISRIYTDPHSPSWARVLGTMANSRDFRSSFRCPVREPVCELW